MAKITLAQEIARQSERTTGDEQMLTVPDRPVAVTRTQIWEALLATAWPDDRAAWTERAMDKIGIHATSRTLFRDRVEEVQTEFPVLECRDRISVCGYGGGWEVSRTGGLNVEATKHQWDGHRFSLVTITVPLWWCTKL